MSLANLVRTGQLKEHLADPKEIGRLLAAAERALADVRVAGLSKERMILLDTLRRKRNLNDYTGEKIDDNSVKACTENAERLLRDAKARIGKRK